MVDIIVAPVESYKKHKIQMRGFNISEFVNLVIMIRSVLIS